MVIRKIGIVNFKLVTGNFATRKHYHLKLSTRKKQLATCKSLRLVSYETFFSFCQENKMFCLFF